MKNKYVISGVVCFVLFSFGSSAQATVVNLSLNSSDWKLSDYAKQDIPTPTITNAGSNLQGTILSGNPGSPWGIEVESNNTYNFQDATLRFKWLVNGLGSYSQTVIGLFSPDDSARVNFNIANNGNNAGFTTGWTYAGSQYISDNTWLYSELTYTTAGLAFSVSYNGYGTNIISSGTQAFNQTVWDRIDDAAFRYRLADNYRARQYFQIEEITLTTDDAGGTIPEPATLALMGLGLAGIGYRRKKAK